MSLSNEHNDNGNASESGEARESVFDRVTRYRPDGSEAEAQDIPEQGHIDVETSYGQQGRPTGESPLNDIVDYLENELTEQEKVDRDRIKQLLHGKTYKAEGVRESTRKDAKVMARETPLHRAIAVAKADGRSNKQICQQFGVSQRLVWRLNQQEWFTDLVLEIQAERHLSHEARLHAMSHAALDELQRLQSNAKSERVRVTVNQDILDRVLGRPVQRVATISQTIKNEAASPEEVEQQRQALRERMQRAEEEKARLREMIAQQEANTGNGNGTSTGK